MMDRTQFHRQLQHLTPAEIAPLDAMAGPGFPAMWYDMASSMYAWLVDAPVAGLSNPDKAALSILLTMQIADAMGGEMHYLPKGRSWRGQALADYVVAAFSGRNHCELAAETGAVCVLKDACTVTAAPDGNTWISLAGNPGMATAGSGDVLTGILAGVLAMFLNKRTELPDTGRQAALGVLLHGMAGDAELEGTGLLEAVVQADAAGQGDPDARQHQRQYRPAAAGGAQEMPQFFHHVLSHRFFDGGHDREAL